MPSFNKPLIVKKINGRSWEIVETFKYFLFDPPGGSFVRVPNGFITDFASVPRPLWAIIPPDGKYTQAAVLHDYLYQKKFFSRKRCDMVFNEAMKILGVPLWKRRVMYRALRIFGWIAWRWGKVPQKK